MRRTKAKALNRIDGTFVNDLGVTSPAFLRRSRAGYPYFLRQNKAGASDAGLVVNSCWMTPRECRKFLNLEGMDFRAKRNRP